MPPLGKKKALPLEVFARSEPVPVPPRVSVACSSSPRAVLISERDKLQAFIPVKESHWDEQEATLVLEPDLPDDGAFLDGLRGSGTQLFLAYRNNAAIAYVEEVQHRTENAVDRWRLTVRIRQSDFSNSMEMSTTGLTADDAAVLRARRVLLNDQLADPNGDMNGVLREILIAGQGTAIEVKGSPFPPLYKALSKHPQIFVEAAWILAILYLKASAAMEYITNLTLELVGNKLRVQCSGRRTKRYTNQPAFKLEVSGTCPLAEQSRKKTS